jgi:hypothetical protein
MEQRWIDTDRENRSVRRKIWRNEILSTTKFTWNGLFSNPSFRTEASRLTTWPMTGLLGLINIFNGPYRKQTHLVTWIPMTNQLLSFITCSWHWRKYKDGFCLKNDYLVSPYLQSWTLNWPDKSFTGNPADPALSSVTCQMRTGAITSTECWVKNAWSYTPPMRLPVTKLN